MTAPYNFTGGLFSRKPALTGPVSPGFDVIIKPDQMRFRHGTTGSMARLRDRGTVGTVVQVDDDTRIEVNFGSDGQWLFDASELLDAPRKADAQTGDKPEDTKTGGMKYDADKPRMDLLFSGCPNALDAVGRVLTFGAEKYAAHSWQTVPNGDERYLAALIRHLTAIGKGEQTDPESGLSHLAHVACNALFILELECRKKTGTSDAI